MTHEELLMKYIDQEKQNMIKNAANWGMSKPMKGREKEFFDAVERAIALENLLAELEAKDND